MVTSRGAISIHLPRAGTAVSDTNIYVVGGYTYKQGDRSDQYGFAKYIALPTIHGNNTPTDDTGNITRTTRLELSLKILPDQVENISMLD